MSSERWLMIEEIFQDVLDRPPAERDQFLVDSCRGDESLQRAVESLLESEKDGSGFLEAPLISPLSPLTPLETKPPEAVLPNDGRMGPYRLLHQIGQGGTSRVFLAVRDDKTFQRRVAIKILRRGMESQEALRRLRIERQILASLDHPSIARLYDGGTTAEGLPYFVMEYVEGQPIDVYCDHHQLSVAARVDLFRKVCAAVHYAHQNLVVHRDLKPSNLLVTADGEPKLLDFGIAKLLNPELSSSDVEPTASWLRMLTPHYASPEQLRGDQITTASDVYSLGVMLYKLLTHRLPFDFSGKTHKEVERLLCDEEPTLPSLAVSKLGQSSTEELETIAQAMATPPAQLSRELDGDLDNIVMMALRSVPAKRYSSVENFAEDLRRYTQGFPVLARNDELTYRMGKFLRRNWAAAALTAAAVFFAFAFAIIMALQSTRIARERDQARQERDEKEQVLALVEDIFKLADPYQSKGEHFTVREALDRSADSIKRRLGTQPAMEGALRHTLGTIYMNLGLLPEAEAHLSKVLDLRRELYGEESIEVSQSLSALGAVYRELGKYDRAEDYTVEAVARARRLLGSGHTDLIRPLNDLVTLRCYQGAYDAAEEPSKEALLLARKDFNASRSEIADAVTNRAVVVRQRGDLESAQTLFREGLSLQRRILGEDHPEIANIINNLAVVLKTRGDLVGAERLHREALALRQRLYTDHHSAVAQSLTNLAAVLRARGHYAQANVHYREALDILHQSLGTSHPLTIKVAVSLAVSLIESGDAESAEAWLNDQLVDWRSQLPATDSLLAWAENARGEALTALGRYDEAEPLLQRTLVRFEEMYEDSHPKTRKALERLATHYESRGYSEDAARYRSRLARSGAA